MHFFLIDIRKRRFPTGKIGRNNLSVILVLFLLLSVSCRQNPSQEMQAIRTLLASEESEKNSDSRLGVSKRVRETQPIPIFPDYGSGICLPPNIAPLNFSLPDSVQTAWIDVRSETIRKVFRIGREMTFPEKFWKKLLHDARQSKSRRITLATVTKEKNGTWREYPEITWHIGTEPIDPYLTYRLVQPIDGAYHVLALFERNLENFQTKPLMSNTLMEQNCFNCHTYHNGDAGRMTIHLRKPSEGTLLIDRNHIEKVALPTWSDLPGFLPDSLQMPLNFVYPTWHPDGKWIAFSTQISGISGYTAHRRFINLSDSASNIILYNPDSNFALIDRALWTTRYEETWPAWSHNGKWLYFCRAPKLSADTVSRYPDPTERIRHVFFSLNRIAFDPETGKFADTAETILPGSPGGSYSVPRPSPDGRHLLVCRAQFNSVPYQAEGDLILLDWQEETMRFIPTDRADILNSEESESWHEWSSNGKWIVFASKRMDGHYSLPYIAYFDGRNFSKPFALPQHHGDFYRTCLRSFNLPTFTRTPSEISPQSIANAKYSEARTIELRFYP